MCRVKKTNIEFRLLVNEELVKVFKNKRMLEIFIKEFEIKNYNVEVV